MSRGYRSRVKQSMWKCQQKKYLRPVVHRRGLQTANQQTRLVQWNRTPRKPRQELLRKVLSKLLRDELPRHATPLLQQTHRELKSKCPSKATRTASLRPKNHSTSRRCLPCQTRRTTVSRLPLEMLEEKTPQWTLPRNLPPSIQGRKPLWLLKILLSPIQVYPVPVIAKANNSRVNESMAARRDTYQGNGHRSL